ncbi:MAG: hypothetical protein JWM44_3037 [Bacilli bacterium]|nr:hypothetical protein [Bacilli bacterium]
MIKFIHKDISQIIPWEQDNTLFLHWFGLTDSYYWLALGKHELLRYSDEFINKHDLDRGLPYVDYQFARLYWDFVDVLQYIITPIPNNVFECIDTMEKFESYLNTLTYWLENIWNESDEEFDELYVNAREWIFDRRLDMGYLVGGPNIFFFRVGDLIYIRWIADYTDDGIAMWKETKGEYVLQYADFLNSIQTAFETFAITMDEQIKSILERPRENIFVDKEQLIKNQDQLTDALSSKWIPSDYTDWNIVLSKMKIINTNKIV